MVRVSVVTASSESGIFCIQELLTALKGSVEQIVAAFRTEEKAAVLRAQEYFDPNIVKIVVGVDATKPETLAPAFEGCDVALVVTPLDYSAGMSKDAENSANMINSAVGAGVGHIIYVGSFTVNRPKMVILASRFLPTEELLTNLAAEGRAQFTVLRGGYFSKNFESMAQQIKTKSTLTWAKELIIPPVDVADIGRSAAHVAAAPDRSVHFSKFYEMSGPSFVTGQSVADDLSEVLGRKITFVPIPAETLLANVPPFLREAYGSFIEDGEAGAPLSQDILHLTGRHTSFREWLNNNAHIFN
eukprot:c46608_g1_i1.p1 GENE.c46608_g1_i1~~c46608_g1_i1.p1  ORF type:complete len:301 (+),score=79.36 c46608_g1_i1:29-931(+)